jgi:hypothetical protein
LEESLRKGSVDGEHSPDYCAAPLTARQSSASWKSRACRFQRPYEPRLGPPTRAFRSMEFDQRTSFIGSDSLQRL